MVSKKHKKDWRVSDGTNSWISKTATCSIKNMLNKEEHSQSSYAQIEATKSWWNKSRNWNRDTDTDFFQEKKVEQGI